MRSAAVVRVPAEVGGHGNVARLEELITGLVENGARLAPNPAFVIMQEDVVILHCCRTAMHVSKGQCIITVQSALRSVCVFMLPRRCHYSSLILLETSSSSVWPCPSFYFFTGGAAGVGSTPSPSHM